MVFEGSGEHDGAQAGGDAVAEVIGVVQVGGDAQPQDADQLVDRSRASRPGEDDRRVLVPTDRVADDPARVLSKPRGLQAGATGLGVSVGVARQYLVPDEVLDEGQGCLLYTSPSPRDGLL